MKVTTIACSYERKFNLGDYNSLKLEVTSWADLEDGDDPAECRRKLLGECRDHVRDEFVALKAKLKPNQSVEAKSQVAPETVEG